MLNIHESIKEKLNYFNKIQKIPNIIFHGSSGCGKKTIVNNFINQIYNGDKEKIRSFVMYVNCAHGKGIKFIREDLKFFAKTHINSNNGNIFKSIILLNADKLTSDAQSALRRCIEIFSYNTRFFIIVEDKYTLLKPILSRFSEIYIPEPNHNGIPINLYKYNINETFKIKELINNETELETLILFCKKIYEKGYCGLDILTLLENPLFLELQITPEKRYELLITFNRVKKEIRNEKLIIFFILNFLFLNLEINLENISFI